MRNLNDPLMTSQEKAHRLQLATSPELKKRHEEEARKGNVHSSAYHWLVTMEDVMKFAVAAENTDTIFQLETQELQKIYPHSSAILFGYDKVEQGEWDNFYNRCAPYGYQDVLVMVVNGILHEVTDIHTGEWSVFSFSDSSDEQLEPYPNTRDLIDSGTEAIFLGILEIPLKELDAYEDQKVYERTWCTSQPFGVALKRMRDFHQKEIQAYASKSKKKGPGRGFGK